MNAKERAEYLAARAARCGVCGAAADTIGVVTEEGGERHPCRTCLGRENVRIDQDFGVGVPGLIARECYALRDMLHAKNAAYGNSALNPLRIFSKAPNEEQIRVRIDDKLSRLMRGSAAGEDVELDLLGYLILLRIARATAP